jgi:hypothetical protein
MSKNISFHLNGTLPNKGVSTMKTKLVSLFGVALLLAGGARSSSAGEISTPIMFPGNAFQLLCVANNVSNEDITVTVTIVGDTSNGTSTCTLKPTDRTGCQAFLNGQLGHCRISVTGLTNGQVRTRLRGLLFNRNISPPFTVFTTVDAR